jgi:DNA-binding XRE family transcriptional regulator
MGERIKTVRNKLGLTQQQMAGEIGILRQPLQSAEKGKTNPSKQTIMLICDRFNVNEEWLRNGTGEMFAKKPNTATVDEIWDDYCKLKGKFKAAVDKCILELAEFSKTI